MTGAQYTMITPDITMEAARARYQAMMQEILHMFQYFGRNVIHELDAARKAMNDDYNNFKSVLHDENKTKLEIDHLRNQLQLAQQREHHYNERIEMYKEKIQLLNAKMDALGKDDKKFREYHATLTKEYERQDETHLKQMNVSILVFSVVI